MNGKIPLNTDTLGHIVAFYHNGVLQMGVINGFQRDKFQILLASGELSLLSPRRILLQSTTLFESSTNALQTFIDNAKRQVIPELKISTKGETLAQLAQANTITDDVQIFALLLLLKSNPQIYAQKHELFFKRSPEGQEEYIKTKQEQQQRADYLDQVESLLKNNNANPDLSLKQRLIEDLRCILRGERIEDLEKTIKTVFPQNSIMALRADLGDTLPIEDPPLLASGLPIAFIHEYTEEFLPCTSQINEELEVISIDDEQSKDIDDALSITDCDGNFHLGIHVSNPASYLNYRMQLFNEAKERVSSLYLPSGIVPMLPPRYSEHLFSLKENEAKPVLSLYCTFNDHGTMLKSNLALERIQITKNCSYNEADRYRHQSEWLPYYKIADQLRNQKDSVNKADSARFYYKLSTEQNEISFTRIDMQSPSRQMIEEMMILYNSSIAQFALNNRIPVLYRNINQYFDEEKNWQVSTAYLDTHAHYHPGINAPAYLHSTSPIRRFVDMLNQMQVCNFISGKLPLLTENELKNLIPHIEKRILLLRETARRSERYWLFKYIAANLMHQPLEGFLKAIVNGKYKVEIMPWAKQVLLVLDASPQAERFNFVIYAIDWDRMLLKADLIS